MGVPEKIRHEFQARMAEKEMHVTELRARLEAAEAAASTSVADRNLTEEICSSIHERLKVVLAGLDIANRRMERATERREALHEICDQQQRQRLPGLFSIKAAEVLGPESTGDPLEERTTGVEDTEMTDADMRCLELTCKRLRQNPDAENRPPLDGGIWL